MGPRLTPGFVLGDRTLTSAGDTHPLWCSAYGALGAYHTIGASVAGHLHLARGRPRDDAFVIRSCGTWLAVAVADGLGSRDLSRYGSTLAVEWLTNRLLSGLPDSVVADRTPPALTAEAVPPGWPRDPELNAAFGGSVGTFCWHPPLPAPPARPSESARAEPDTTEVARRPPDPAARRGELWSDAFYDDNPSGGAAPFEPGWADPSGPPGRLPGAEPKRAGVLKAGIDWLAAMWGRADDQAGQVYERTLELPRRPATEEVTRLLEPAAEPRTGSPRERELPAPAAAPPHLAALDTVAQGETARSPAEADTDPLYPDLNGVVRQAFEETREAIIQRAGQLGVQVEDLGCTLLGVLLDTRGGGCAVGQIGDGAILGTAADGTTMLLVAAPESGDPSATYPLVHPDWQRVLRVAEVPRGAAADAIFVMTDGVANDCLPGVSPRDLARWASGLTDQIRATEPPAAASRVLRWLATYRRADSFDDRSLVVIYR